MSCHRCTQIKTQHIAFCKDQYERCYTPEEVKMVDAEMQGCPVPKVGTERCDTCLRFYCKPCYKHHDKYNECFCEINTECHTCGEKGSYDYGLHNVYCNGCS